MPYAPKNSPEITWPDLDESYIDEYGPIDRDVYGLASRLWPSAEALIRRTIQDLTSGQRLMMKAVAIVSRKLKEQPDKMTNVHGYLYRTFNHLVYEEIEKQKRHDELQMSMHNEKAGVELLSDANIYETILVQEILARADNRTREIYALRILGHSFKEIAERFGMRDNMLRKEWSEKIRKLAKQIQEETQAAELKALRGNRRP